MTQLVTFFESLISYIELIWDIFLNIISGIADLVAAVISATVMPPALAAWIGGPIAASISAVAGFSILKIIVGRSNV